jgi:hypothetical protein
MIVVFVVDTSPSMALPSQSQSGSMSISRLDLAKMSVENLSRSMDKRILEHNRSVLMASAQQHQQQSHQSIDVGRLEQFDEFLLLSSSLQPDNVGSLLMSPSSTMDSLETHAACGAGGRLLVGSVEDDRSYSMSDGGGVGQHNNMVPHPPDRHDFEYELKRLKTAMISENTPFPDWAGGALGLNAALSHGLGLLSRYRLTRGRDVEHFGMGRLPWFQHQMAKKTPNNNNMNKQQGGGGDDSSAVNSPLQPACLILLTDGECLRSPSNKGGGGLSLRFGNMPLREFYKEPFRWDQRIFILHTADVTTPPLHKSLRALCEVTGGAYIRINPTDSISNILLRIAPPRPTPYSIPDPLRLSAPTPVQFDSTTELNSTTSFINGGPVCSFQCMESGPQQQPAIHRAMIMFAGSCEQPRWILNPTASAASSLPQQSKFIPSPIWSIPESHFPSKKLDTLPPRPSQPLLHYSRNYQAVGSPAFDPYYVMKALHHLDYLYVSIRQLLVDSGDNNPPPISNRMLQRDVYICDWLGGEEIGKRGGLDASNVTGAPRTEAGREHFPVSVRGAGQPNVSGEGADNVLNIGILHVPRDWIKLKNIGVNATKTDESLTSRRVSTLTLLPPDPHILIPLLIKVAEIELRMLKKVTENNKEASGVKSGATAGLIKKKINSATAARAIHLDDGWKSDFRAYLFRLPPYYLPAMRRVLRSMLPPNVLQLLNVESQDTLPLLCMSPTCLNKIHSGEKAARDGNDWLRGMEQNMRKRKARSLTDEQSHIIHPRSISGAGKQDEDQVLVGYGEFDPRTMTEQQYKHMLRHLPPPWKNGKKEKYDSEDCDKGKNDEGRKVNPVAMVPTSCLLAFYESRRRWIFGGSSLATRGLHVEGVNNDGVNTHHYNSSQSIDDVPLIALAGLCDTVNQTSLVKMGDFREKMNFSPVSFVDYGGSNGSGAAVTTAADGSPKYSVDDDVLPLHFFDSSSGEFVDSPQARYRARTSINFGNPFHDKRGGSVCPSNYGSQRPPIAGGNPATPPSSPPHDAYESSSPIEGEGEAAFTGKRPGSPPSIRHAEFKKRDTKSSVTASGKRENILTESSRKPLPSRPPPPPPPPQKRPSIQSTGHKIVPPPPPGGQKNTPQKPPPPKRLNSREEMPQSTPQQAPPKRMNSRDGIPQSATATSQSSQQSQTIDLQNPSEKPKMALPEGWICVWSKSNKRWYFFDTKTNKSVWDPEHIKAAQQHHH